MLSWIIKLFRKCFSFCIKHPKSILFGIGATAAGLGTAGAINTHKAKKINQKATDIWKEALAKHDKAYELVQEKLTSLGQTEQTVIDSFPWFADLIECIQGRPIFKTSLFSRVKLPHYEPEELEQLSIDLKMAVDAGVGAGAGALMGLAAFGAQAIVAAPAMLTAGVVICVKGAGFKKKAIENKRRAESMSESVDEVIAFYDQLGKTSDTYRDSISAVYSKYNQHLYRVQNILTHKAVWQDFTREEKTSVENAVLLARLLYQMCIIRLVIKRDDEEQIEKINESEIRKLERNAGDLLAGLA